MTHICVGNLTITGPDNGLSPGRRQAIIWTNAGILLTGPLGTNFNEILIGIQTFSFKKMHLKVSSAKWRPFCLGLNLLIENLFCLWPWYEMDRRLWFCYLIHFMATWVMICFWSRFDKLSQSDIMTVGRNLDKQWWIEWYCNTYMFFITPLCIDNINQ